MSKTNPCSQCQFKQVGLCFPCCSDDISKAVKETEKRVVDEVINRFENCRNMVDFNYALNEYIRDFGVSDE